MERTAFIRAGHPEQASARGFLAVSVFFITTCSLGAAADELAFGDVGANGISHIRFLDDPLPGLEGGPRDFLGEHATWVHDWAHVRIINRSFNSVSRLASFNPLANRTRIAELEAALRPLFVALPKKAHGLLGNATARYAAHRYFAATRGWFVKGLQPAGASWMATMAVTPEVKDISKYIVPSYIQELLSRQHHAQGTDLRGLAILVATLEHLVHAEALETLYHVFRALQLDSKTNRTEQDSVDILDTFMLVFAFGGVLDRAARGEILRARDLVASGVNRARWQEATALSQQLLQRFGDSHGSKVPQDFSQFLDVVGGASVEYSRWHSHVCDAAKEQLAAFDPNVTGRLPLDAFRAAGRNSSAFPRQLFGETAEELQGFGALAEDSGHRPQVLLASYLSSPAMCLSTASFYQVCCPNACEALLSELELAAMAPGAPPSMIAGAVERRRRRPLEPHLLQQLDGFAAQTGDIALHGRALAEWLHSAMPRECPAPHAAWSTSPMTPDAWLAPPPREMKALEKMIKEADIITRRYTHVYDGARSAPAALKDLALQGGEPLLKWYANERRLTNPAAGIPGSRISDKWTGLILLLCCVSVAAGAGVASLKAAWGGSKQSEALLDAV